jgi:hypothetical protein
MFRQSPDERLSTWKEFRNGLEQSDTPFLDVINFWASAPYIPYNHNVDPYNQYSWPTPWEILLQNKYDDFTKALMMAYTLKYTNKFGNSDIQVKTLVDNAQKSVYNIVLVDDIWVLNFQETTLVEAGNVPEEFRLENIVVIERPK